jgi:DNA adenine methylase
MIHPKQHSMAQPFLRWAGGKRWLARAIAPRLRELVADTRGRYFEPFLGGGAMFFAVAPRKAQLSDNNESLISTFCQVRDRHKEIQEILQAIPVSAKSYYKIRAATNVSHISDAVRFIFLNRTCYGGIYRTNQLGQFNVPYGGGSRTPENLWKNKILERSALLLQHSGISITCCDFAASFDSAKRGDVIYCDPIYRNPTRSQFDRYNAEIFSWADQERLAEFAEKAAKRGVFVLVSNGASREIGRLFRVAQKIVLKRKKAIGKRANNDETHREMLYVFSPKNSKPFLIDGIIPS